MLKLFIDLLDKERLEVWEKLVCFKDYGTFADGTALALQLNHRKSFDLDIFIENTVKQNLLLKVGDLFGRNNLEVVIDSPDELTVLFKKEIKISFVYFPFKPLHEKILTKSLDLFDVKDLFSNKAYAVGRRGAWRDYVDVYFGLSCNIINFPKLIDETEKRFKGAFSKKLFFEQLTYFEDINDWSIEWIGEKIYNEKIKEFLLEQVNKYL